MLLTHSLNKFSQLLLVSGLMLASGVVAAQNTQTTMIKLEQDLSDLKVMVNEGQGNHVIHFDKSELGSAQLDEKISQLPAESQEKVRKLLTQIESGEGKNVFVLKDKVIEAYTDGDDITHKMVFISQGYELNIDIPPPPAAPNAPKHPEHVKVMKFALDIEGEGGHEFAVIKSLLQNATLTPEQIDEIQTLLNSK